MILKNCTDPASEQGQVTGSQAQPILPAEAVSSPHQGPPGSVGPTRMGHLLLITGGQGKRQQETAVLGVNTQGDEITKGSYTQKLQRRIACLRTNPGNMDVMRVPVKTCRMVPS